MYEVRAARWDQAGTGLELEEDDELLKCFMFQSRSGVLRVPLRVISMAVALPTDKLFSFTIVMLTAEMVN